MRFRVLLVALLAALGAGCGGDGDGGEPSQGATAPSGITSTGTESGTSTPEAGATPATTAPPPIPDIPSSGDEAEGTGTKETSPQKGGEPSAPKGATRDSRRVERYLRQNFGGEGGQARAGWYDHVVEVAVSGETTTVRTDLSANPAGRRLARQICLDVRGSIPGVTDRVRVTGLAQAGALAGCVP